ncbi:hypothetical protein Q75_09210 [Bacillus coahuilensis p1.1.43]|uniref:PCZ2.2 n=1 Tax=Bacillus coahuilensis p1.1.43 TaxID=1150625 RepID=A0A147K8B3_9BACI|nr:hypothetical protein [Bacillus coahuilensis]KUP06307.1 hypothetical protein Q75_09210 [Bacillus coahuilensis p1.1.43]
MDSIIFIALFINPLFCCILVLKSVALVKQIHQGNYDTGENTAWVTISFTLIVTSITWMIFLVSK